MKSPHSLKCHFSTHYTSMSFFTNNIAMSECSHAAYCTFYMFEYFDELWVGGGGGNEDNSEIL